MRVLLVDDSPRFTLAAMRFLSLLPDMEVIGQARSGREALDQVDRMHPDLVLMDVGMPGMDGLEATRRIKCKAEPPQIIIVTLHDSAEYRSQAENAGADGFVSKQDFATALPAAVEGLRTTGNPI
jgi:DNA-binding NarL/FixJ family response regulator